jgi:hypothetical protein
MAVGGHPVQEPLGANRLGVEEAGSTEDAHEQLGLEGDGPGAVVIDRDPVTGEIDKQLLSGLVLLAHDHVEVATPAPVVLAVLAVGVAVGEGLLVLEPQQHQGDVRTAELPVNGRPVGRGTGRRRRCCRREQPGLQGVVVHAVGQRPAQPGGLGPLHVVGHRGERDLERGSDLLQ